MGDEGGIAKHGRSARDSKTWERRQGYQTPEMGDGQQNTGDEGGYQNMGDEGGIAKHGRSARDSKTWERREGYQTPEMGDGQ